MEATRPLNVVTIGGGGGHWPVARAMMLLKQRLDLAVTAIVTTLDSGGSSGLLRAQTGFGVGDTRKVMSAFAPAAVRHMLEDRLPDGHALGNLILQSYFKPGADPQSALDQVHHALQLTCRVAPVTFDDAHVHAELTDGTVYENEDAIYHADIVNGGQVRRHVHRLWVEPADITANPVAIDAIREADFIVFCPGTLLCSILPPILVPGVREALLETQATPVCIANLMNRQGHMPDTANVMDHIAFIERYLGQEGFFDYVVYNTAPFPPELLEVYAKEHKAPTLALDHRSEGRKPIGWPLLDTDAVADKLRQISAHCGSLDALALLRSPVSHSPTAIAEVLEKIFPAQALS